MQTLFVKHFLFFACSYFFCKQNQIEVNNQNQLMDNSQQLIIPFKNAKTRHTTTV